MRLMADHFASQLKSGNRWRPQVTRTSKLYRPFLTRHVVSSELSKQDFAVLYDQMS
jgi:hypothetical protein